MPKEFKQRKGRSDMSYIWEDALTEVDKLVIEKGGYGQRRGFGNKPAFVIIDAQYNYVGADKPIEEQLEEWPSGGGEKAWRAIEKIQKLKKEDEEANIHGIYTHNDLKITINLDTYSVIA